MIVQRLMLPVLCGVLVQGCAGRKARSEPAPAAVQARAVTITNQGDSPLTITSGDSPGVEIPARAMRSVQVRWDQARGGKVRVVNGNTGAVLYDGPVNGAARNMIVQGQTVSFPVREDRYEPRAPRAFKP